MNPMSVARPIGALVSFIIAVGCGSPTTSPPSTAPAAPGPLVLHPPLDGPAPDCASHPHLCGLSLTDLGGGEHPRAFHLVFVGDGFVSGEDFVAVIERLHGGLVTDVAGPVTFDPDLFHFWRVDLESASAATVDDERRDTPLGAGLLPPDSCVGEPFITVDGPRTRLALQEATTAGADTPIKDLQARGFVHAIVVVADSTGRANASLDVRISSFDSVQTLRHELGHALFQLADEYAEFDACPDGALIDAAHHTDGDLAHVVNIQRSIDPAKWQGLSSESFVGGSRVPCLHHASPSCLMEGSGDAFCPVCLQGIAERLDLQRCRDGGADGDVFAPRVVIDAPLREADLVILPGGSSAVVRAVVDDTHDGGLPIRWLLDGEVVAEGAVAELDLVALNDRLDQRDGGALKDAVFVASAEDARGNVGVSRPVLLDEALPGLLELEQTDIGSVPGRIGVRVESLRPFDVLEVKSAIETLVVDSGPFGTATVALRVPLVGEAMVQVSARSADGRLHAAAQTLRVTTTTATATTTLPAAPLVTFAPGSDAFPLGRQSLLFVDVRACVAVVEVGVVIADDREVLERVPAQRASVCSDGQVPPPIRYAVDVDDAVSRVVPVVVDVTGRRSFGPPLEVVRADELLEDCVEVTVGRPKSPFDAVVVEIGAGVGGLIVEASAVVGGRTLELGRVGAGLQGRLFPVDLDQTATRLRVSTTARCADGVTARVRTDVDVGGLVAAIDVRPPLVLPPLHAPREATRQDVLVIDDRGLERVLVDGVAVPVTGTRITLQAAPGATIEVVDTAGLVTRAVVGARLPPPRVPACE